MAGAASPGASVNGTALAVDGEYHIAEHIAADDAHGTEAGEPGILFEQQGGNVGKDDFPVGCGHTRHGHPGQRDGFVVGINGYQRVGGRPAEAVGKRFQKRGLAAGVQERKEYVVPSTAISNTSLPGDKPVRYRRNDGLRLCRQAAEAEY